LIKIYDRGTRLVGEEALAWQELPADARVNLSREATENDLLSPVAPATVFELEELWKKNSKSLMEVRSRPRDENDDSEDGVLWDETIAVEPYRGQNDSLSNRTTVALTIDFSRFSDSEINEAFLRWLLINRPRKWRKPQQTFLGATPERTEANRVPCRTGKARANAPSSLAYTSRASRRLRRGLGKDSSKRKGFSARDSRGFEVLSETLPVLPEEERPLSEQRNGVWSPPIQRMLDKMEHEKSARGDNK